MSAEQEIQALETAYQTAMNWARRKQDDPEEQMKEYVKAARAQKGLADLTDGAVKSRHMEEYQRLTDVSYKMFAALHPEKIQPKPVKKEPEPRPNPVRNTADGAAPETAEPPKPLKPGEKRVPKTLYSVKQLNGIDVSTFRYDDPAAMKTTFSDLNGSDHDAKGLVLQHFERIRQNKRFQKLQKTAEAYAALQPSLNIFLYGPPGTGKSAFISAMCHYVLSHEEDSVAFILEPDNYRADLVGIAEKVLKEVFFEARQYQNAIICVDEIVGLCPGPDVRKGSGNHGMDTLNMFLNEIDGVRKSEGNIIVVGGTNYPWQVDTAAISRLPNRFYLGLPDKEALASFLMAHARPFMGVDEAEQREMADYIASKMTNASYREIKQVAADLYHESDLKTKRANHDNPDVESFIPLTLDEVEQKVLKDVEIHVDPVAQQRYEQFRSGEI